MGIEEVMEKKGFRLSAGCSGQAAYTRFVNYNGKRAYVSVTGVDDEGFPSSLDEPVRVMIYDLRSGDELEPGQDFSSLAIYLESINKD